MICGNHNSVNIVHALLLHSTYYALEKADKAAPRAAFQALSSTEDASSDIFNDKLSVHATMLNGLKVG